MSRKLIALLLAILVSALIFSACGGDNDQALNEEAEAAPVEAPSEFSVPEPATEPAPELALEPAPEELVAEAPPPEEKTTTVEGAPTGPERVSLIALDYSSQPDSAIHVTADGGGAPEAPDTPLFRQVGASYHPLLAPDGHQLTRAEWATAEGTATITCEEGGTRYELEFSGLVPDGVYTIWHFPTTEPISSRLPSGQIEDARPMASGKGLDGGALGKASGDENSFTADAEGKAVLNVLAAERTNVPKCTLSGGVFLVLLYHIDDRAWGSEPGPEETNAWQGVFNYPPLEDSAAEGGSGG